MPIDTRNTRNPVARAAILRKGGVHEKCHTSGRQQQKRQLEDAVDDYFLSRYSRSGKSRGGGSNNKKSNPDIKGTIKEKRKVTEISGLFFG